MNNQQLNDFNQHKAKPNKLVSFGPKSSQQADKTPIKPNKSANLLILNRVTRRNLRASFTPPATTNNQVGLRSVLLILISLFFFIVASFLLKAGLFIHSTIFGVVAGLFLALAGKQ